MVALAATTGALDRLFRGHVDELVISGSTTDLFAYYWHVRSVRKVRMGGCLMPFDSIPSAYTVLPRSVVSSIEHVVCDLPSVWSSPTVNLMDWTMNGAQWTALRRLDVTLTRDAPPRDWCQMCGHRTSQCRGITGSMPALTVLKMWPHGDASSSQNIKDTNSQRWVYDVVYSVIDSGNFTQLQKLSLYHYGSYCDMNHADNNTILSIMMWTSTLTGLSVSNDIWQRFSSGITCPGRAIYYAAPLKVLKLRHQVGQFCIDGSLYNIMLSRLKRLEICGVPAVEHIASVCQSQNMALVHKRAAPLRVLRIRMTGVDSSVTVTTSADTLWNADDFSMIKRVEVLALQKDGCVGPDAGCRLYPAIHLVRPMSAQKLRKL